jgi:hypothetical protein
MNVDDPNSNIEVRRSAATGGLVPRLFLQCNSLVSPGLT